MKTPNTLVGAAGVHYIAYKLSAMGMIVGLTREGTDAIDLMTGDILNGRATAIQVKTARSAEKTKYWEWSVGRKPLSMKNSELVYAFVDLKEESEEDTPPTVFIVPIKDVIKQLIDAGFEEHPEYSRFYFKIYIDDKNKYYENWSLIKDVKMNLQKQIFCP